jgi:hypothetical protein
LARARQPANQLTGTLTSATNTGNSTIAADAEDTAHD